MSPSSSVPVGVTSIIGYVLGAAQIAGAVVLYLNGEHGAAGALLGSGQASALVTAAGRYLQAHKQIATTIAHVEAVAGEIAPPPPEVTEPPEAARVPDGSAQAPPPPAAA
jgi:hypothetical protein